MWILVSMVTLLLHGKMLVVTTLIAALVAGAVAGPKFSGRPRAVDDYIRAALPNQYLARGKPEFQDDGTVLVEMDMKLTREQYEALHGGKSSYKGMLDETLRWTNNIVPYKIADYFSDADKKAIRGALDEWEKYTCLKFKVQTTEKNYVNVISGQGCWSMVGMIGFRQDMSLQIGSCTSHATIGHEFGHAIGFHHEQTRPDRDDYVTVLRDNIIPGLEYNFDKYPEDVVGDFGVKYDYLSLMHYSQYAFSDKGEATILTKDKDYSVIIGTAPGLSFKDIQAANIMYKCDSKCTNKCPENAIRNKDCKCWCNSQNPRIPVVEWDGVSECKGGDDLDDPCKDYYDECADWAEIGECDDNAYWMSQNCMKSCQVCGDNPACRDFDDWCPYWAMIGECTRNAGWMGTNCRYSCKICGEHPPVGECDDKWDLCESAALNGDCATHSESMLTECPDSCKTCGDDKECKNWDSRCGIWKEAGWCTSDKEFMDLQCAQECGFCTGGTLPDCRDYAKASDCEWWAGNGECGGNPGWVMRKCPKSCLVCGDDAICKDRDPLCHIWGFDGACEDDKEYMSIVCRAECGLCEGDDDDKPGCKDYEHNCDTWVKDGECDINPGGMLWFCPKGCKGCGAGTLCKDWFEDCADWAADGDCTYNKAYMDKHCPKSCDTCCDDPEGCDIIGGPDPGECSEMEDDRCINFENDCDTKAANGECFSDPDDMLRLCPLACNLCGDNAECHDYKDDCPAWTFSGECVLNPSYMDMYCRKSCRCCETPDGPEPGKCSDIEEDRCINFKDDCQTKAAGGDCYTNPGDMLRECPLACNLCGDNAICYDYKDDCEYWETIGECKNNPTFMDMYCRDSCGCCD